MTVSDIIMADLRAMAAHARERDRRVHEMETCLRDEGFEVFSERFCDRGPNAGKPGPCPGEGKRFSFKVSPGVKRLGLLGAGVAAGAVGSKTQLARALSGIGSKASTRAARRLDKVIAKILGAGGIKIVRGKFRQHAEDFCDQGANKGKPGPCPSLGRSVLRGAAAGALVGAGGSLGARLLARKLGATSAGRLLSRRSLRAALGRGGDLAIAGGGIAAVLHAMRRKKSS